MQSCGKQFSGLSKSNRRGWRNIGSLVCNGYLLSKCLLICLLIGLLLRHVGLLIGLLLDSISLLVGLLLCWCVTAIHWKRLGRHVVCRKLLCGQRLLLKH